MVAIQLRNLRNKTMSRDELGISQRHWFNKLNRRCTVPYRPNATSGNEGGDLESVIFE
jgi:hypothetical protein